MIEINRLDGTTILTLEDIPEGSLVHRELGGDHYCKLPFILEEPVYLRIGDYVILQDFGRFELVDPYSPKYDKETAGYKYELQLDAYYIKWRNKVVRYMPTSAASETSFHLTATIDVHLGVIVNGINAIGAKDANFRYDGLEFKFQLFNFPADKVKAAKYKQYNNTNYISALNDLAQIFDCEWWVDGNIIFFGKCKLDGDDIDFELDVNVEEMGGSESKNDYATRIIAFGSDRNLPKDYRKNSSADITQNGVVQKRLMLPLKGEHACPNGYVQDANVYSETEAIEIVIVDEDVYPRTKCKVREVETYTKTYEDEETNETVTKTYYRIYDSSGLNFSTDYILEGETLHIIFQSGKMNGMDFECHYDDKKKYYEVVVNEDYGRELPDSNLHPEVGDEFVLYGWDSTKIGNTGLVEAAEEELYQHVIEKAQELKIDPNTYNCSMRSYWYLNKMETESFVVWSLGQPVRLLNPTYFQNGRSSRIIGYEIKLDIPYDMPEYIVGEAAAYSRTKDMEQKIDSITFNGVTYESNGRGGSGVYLITTTSSTPASDYNSYSAKRADKQFLRKDIDDTAYGKITHKERSTFSKGITAYSSSTMVNASIDNAQAEYLKAAVADIVKAGIEEVTSDIIFDKLAKVMQKLLADNIESRSTAYEAGLSGYSLHKTEADRYRLEIDELLVRVKAIFNELEIRKLSFVGGNMELSAAGGEIYRVRPLYREAEEEPYAFRCWLTADDGTTRTRNWWKPGDQAKCQTFNIDGSEVKNGEQALSVDGEMITQNGELITYDDGTGGSTGNKYYWRLVTATGKETLEDGRQYDWIELSNERHVELTADGVTFTCEGMDTVFDGNDIDNMKWHTQTNDWPAQGDSIVQEGSQTDPERQHLIRLNTVGETAPSIEEFSNVGARDGISPWNLSSRRMTVISPRTGDVFVAKRFEIRTDSGIRVPVPTERGEYTDGMVCGYYDRVSYQGSLWLCVCKIGNKVNDTIYPPSEEYKLTDGSKIWLEQIKRGGDGYTVELTPSTMMITQNTEGNFNFSENRVYYKVFAASSDITDDCKLLAVTADDGCNVTTDTDGAEREYVVITSLNGQPDSGKIGIKIGLSNGDVINRELKYYVNYLGSLRNELQNYTIVFSPNVVILNESDNGTFDFEKHWVSFKVYKGKDDITSNQQLIKVAGDYDESTKYGCVADSIKDNNGNIVIAIQNIIGRPEKGKIQATFNVDGYTIVRSIDYYINWLGTFRHTIENDTSRMIAEKTTVTVNGENVSINDAVSQLEQTSKSISSRVENAVTEINGNISTIEKSVSEISQTSNSINMAVYGDDTTEYITSSAGFKMSTGSSHTYSFDDKSDLVKRIYAGAKIVAKIGVSAMSDLTNAYGSLTMKLLVNGNVIGEKTFDYDYFNYDWSTLCTLEATWGITVAVNTIELVIENNLGDWIDEDIGISDEITITSHSIKRKTIVSKEVNDGLKKTGIDITQGKITISAETTDFSGDVNIYGTLQESNKQSDNANGFYPIDFKYNRSISIPAQSLVVLPMCSDVVCEAGGYFKDGYTFPAFQKAGTNVTITAMPVTEIANWSCLKTKLSINGSEVKEMVALDDGLGAADEFAKMHQYMSLVCADPRLFMKYNMIKFVHTASGDEEGRGMSINENNQAKYFFGNMHGRFLVNGSFTRFIALLPGQMLKLKSVIMYGEQVSAGIVKLSMNQGKPIVFWNVENASDFRPINFDIEEGLSEGKQPNKYLFGPTSGNISPLTEFNVNFIETVYGHRLLESSMWGLGSVGANGVITKDNGIPIFYSVGKLQ